MRNTAKYQIVLLTAPSKKVARQLAAAALQARLVACANLIPRVESHYWWQGKMESAAEVLVIFKTIKKHLRALEKLVLVKHPYDTPEFVVLPLSGGNERYLEWINQSVAAPPVRRIAP